MLPEPLLTIPVRFSGNLAFAPDLTQLAVQPSLAQPKATEIYALSDGSLVTRLDITDDTSPWPDQLVYVDDAIVYLEWREDGDVRRWRVVRYRRPGWSREVLAESIAGHQVSLGAIPGGFVVGAPDHLRFGTADGPLSDPVRHPALAEGEATLLTTDPTSGRMAFTTPYPQRLVVLDATLQIVAEAELRQNEAYHGWFCKAETLVTFGMFKALRSWRIADGSLVVQGHTWLPKEDVQFGEHSWPLGLTVVPSRNLVAFARISDPPSWYDARTLDVALAPAQFGDRFPVWMSPADRYAGVLDYSGLHVYDVRG
jgi:hypothetical protein